ncbi:MAG: NmrA/HSCARG family protein [Coriobacteriia bacterium]|nr:NmrA/HSCARG family protein [Coriobacteriia bacterium]
MERSDKTILVIGATGQQGGAATKHLLADGWRVRGLTRDADSLAARSLAAAGVELAIGDLLDRTSLDRAVDGVYGVFSVQNTRTAGAEGELVEGKNIADVALAAGVQHFVYNSAVADPRATQPFMLAKPKIEAHIREIGLPATIWRPVTFMENYLRQRDQILGGKLIWPLWPESMTFMIAVDDIGRFVALAFSAPDRFIGAEMAIGGDAMTMTQVAETFSRTLGTSVEYVHVDELSGIPAPPRPVPGEPQYWRADIAACRELLPGLKTLGEWIAESGWV